MTGHTFEHCYMLHGYPPRHKLHKPRVDETSLDTPAEATLEPHLTLRKEQYQDLIALLHSKDTSASVNQVQSIIPLHLHSSSAAGISLYFSSFSISSSPWIIDAGSTDYMICNTSIVTIITASLLKNVKLPNGNLEAVIHIGTVQVKPTILLHNALCVPSFTFNLFQLENLPMI